MTRDPGSLTPSEEHVRDAVRSLPRAVPDPDFLARLESDFVEGRLEQRERFRERSRRRWATFAVPTAIAALLALVFVRGGREPDDAWLVLGTSGAGTLDWAGETHDLGALPADTFLASADAGAIRVDDGWIEIGRPGVMALRLNAGSSAQLGAPLGGDVASAEWTLSRGEMLVLTGPGFHGRHLAVLTPEGRTEVVGTAFAVYRDESLTCVCVTEGVARIGTDAADLEDVSPGLRKVMYADGRPSEILDIAPEHREGLDEFVTDVRARVDNR